MTYPIPNLSRIWVRGRIIDLGKAATEQDKYGVGQAVTFAPSAKVLINSATQQIIASSAFRVNVSEDNGYFQILLPASDDPDVNPTNFTYAVKEPGTGRGYNIIVPISTPLLNSPGDPLHGQPVIELSDVVPAPGASSGLVQLVSGRGMESFDIVDGNFVATYTDGSTQVVGPVPEGGVGGDTPDATTSVKGKSVLLGGTAAAPTVPWSAVTGKPTIPELPELADVATTGAYADLSGKPAIPSTKSDVGLSNVDNTSDAGKPVSTATQTALDGKVGSADARLSDTRTPGDNSVTNAKVAAGAAISADKVADGTTNKVLTATERTKLAGVATSATANATDAQLRDRATHTGAQTSATISDFTEAVQDAVAELLGAGSNVTLNYDDAGNTLTVSATGSGGTGLDVEQVRDAIGVALVGVGNITVTVNDAADTITVSTTATANSTDAQLRDRGTHTGAQAISTVTGLQTALDGKTALSVDGSFAATYDIDTTPVTAADLGAQPVDADLTTIAALDSETSGAMVTDGSGWIRKTYAQLKTALGLVKGDVGLGNVDNTSDVNKPVSSATTTALTGKVGTGDARLTDTRVPTDASVTNAKVASGAAISADKLADGTTNKVLTATEKTKLGGIATGATVNDTDANLKNRANHTGTQAVSTVTGLATVATSGAYGDLTARPIAIVGTSAVPITNAATARPTGATVVYWLCASGVTPANATNGDLIWNAA